MTKADQDLIDMVEEGQSGQYSGYIRYFAGGIRDLVKMKNPLSGSIMVNDIDRVLEVFNPNLEDDINWFKDTQSKIKLWTNEKIIANRLLGIKNDNHYDIRIFEQVVMEKFFISEKEKPKPDEIIKTQFQNLIELVEMGARRFGR